MRLEFTVIENEAGGQAVAPSLRKVAEIGRQARALADETRKDDPARADEILARLEEAEALWAELRTGTAAKTVAFDMKAFTLGEKLAAERKATRWDNGQPTRDWSVYYFEVTKAAIGLTDEQMNALSPQLGAALIEEVMALSEPDAAKLDFLRSLPLGSGTTEN